MGNGLTDPEIQYAFYPQMAYNNSYGIEVGREEGREGGREGGRKDYYLCVCVCVWYSSV